MPTQLSPHEQQRLSELRARAVLSATEAQELARLLERADAHEAGVLAPSTRALEMENQNGEAENRQLAALVDRKQQLVARLTGALQEARAEREAIDVELRRILRSDPASALAGADR